METTDDFVALLERARTGDQTGWDEILKRLNPLVRSVVGRYSLDSESAADVVQTVWIRLFENADRIRDPRRLAGWLATTSRNESLNRIAELKRLRMGTDPEVEFDPAAVLPLDLLVNDELQADVRIAFEALPVRSRFLLNLLIASPRLSYAEISQLTGRPVGSIGPTRARCLAQLRSNLLVIRGESVA